MTLEADQERIPMGVHVRRRRLSLVWQPHAAEPGEVVRGVREFDLTVGDADTDSVSVGW